MPETAVAEDSETEEETRPDGDTKADSGADARIRRFRLTRRRALVAGLAVLALVAVAAGVLGYLRERAAQTAETDRQVAVQAARQEVITLTSIGKATAQDDLARLLDGATGSFKQQFTQQSDAFKQVLDQSGVESKGVIQEAGVLDSKDGAATVLVAATATVKNTQTPDGAARQYRMKVSLQKQDGKWLVCDLEFVP